MTSSAFYATNGVIVPGELVKQPMFNPGGGIYMPPDCLAATLLMSREIEELKANILELASQLKNGTVTDEELLYKVKSDRYLLDRLRAQKAMPTTKHLSAEYVTEDVDLSKVTIS